MKKCNKCNLEKNITSFCKNKSKKDGLDIYCRDCNKKYKKDYSIKNKEKLSNKSKEYYNNNKETILERVRDYTINNKEVKREYLKEYYNNNKETILERVKDYNIKNKEVKREYYNKYIKNRISQDELFKLSINIRKSFISYFKNGGYKKETKSEDILGCSFEEFKIHLESKFEDWMTWENKGLYNGELNYGWDIDHIKPLSSAETEEDIIKLNHYSNLQPLCSKINRYIKRDNKNYEF